MLHNRPQSASRSQAKTPAIDRIELFSERDLAQRAKSKRTDAPARPETADDNGSSPWCFNEKNRKELPVFVSVILDQESLMSISLSTGLAVHVVRTSVRQPVGCRGERWWQTGIVWSSWHLGTSARIGEVIGCGASDASRSITTSRQLVSHRGHGLLESCRYSVRHA